MRVLIVDDDVQKGSAIASLLKQVSGVEDRSFEHATNVVDAKRILQDKQFDLLILDVVLPLRSLAYPSSEHGLNLLAELLSGRGSLLVPTHIVGITAYKELLVEAEREYSSRLLTLSHYDVLSDGWKVSLLARANHIVSSLRDAGEKLADYEYDLGVVCALQSPELDAILRLPWDWQQSSVLQDDTIYHVGRFESEKGLIRVVAAAAQRMGMPAASVLSSKLIYEFRPRYLAMTGIAAGVPGKCRFGDVLIASTSFDHGNGKFRIDANSEIEFIPSYHHINVSNWLASKLKLLVNDPAIADEIRRGWAGAPPDQILSMKFGPFASGAAVHADGQTIRDLLGRQRDLVGLDMESYGVMVAASEVGGPRPDCFIMKSVVDHADGGKDDSHQRYAGYTSAEALRKFSERILFTEN